MPRLSTVSCPQLQLAALDLPSPEGFCVYVDFHLDLLVLGEDSFECYGLSLLSLDLGAHGLVDGLDSLDFNGLKQAINQHSSRIGVVHAASVSLEAPQRQSRL